MKKRLLYLSLLLTPFFTLAQTVCNPNGDLVLFTNYDGGVLNIDVDVNIPNLKIGIVSYEAVTINLSGAFLNNVVAVQYAGYNGTNNNCGAGVFNTSINGAPGGASTTIDIIPAATISNPNGYPYIICAYSCDITTNQGGCNTIDQIEAYFAAQFPGSVLRSHKVQYNCWSGTQTVSSGGNCCLGGPVPLSVNVNVIPPSCNGLCDGSATAVASGGQPPYTYQWIPGPASAQYNNMCPGVYTIQITDGAANQASQTVVINNPPPITFNYSQTACNSYLFNGNLLNTSGTYTGTFTTAAGCDSTVTLNLTINHSSSHTFATAACNSYTLNSQTYTTSGTYTQTLVNSQGCDSVLTLNLTINQATSSTHTASACTSFTYNGQTYTTSGNYTQTLVNSHGCDSVITLNLTINMPSSSSMTTSACDSYTLNSQTYTASGTYNQTLSNSQGCDSIITLNLTINTVDASATQNGNIFTATTSGAIYQWLDCNNNFAPIVGATNQSYTALASGDFAVIVTQNNCSDTSVCMSLIEGIHDFVLPSHIAVYPNPSTGKLLIEGMENIDLIEIYNVLGEKIYSRDVMYLVATVNSQSSIEIDLSQVAKGIYYLKVYQEERGYSKKVVIQ